MTTYNIYKVKCLTEGIFKEWILNDNDSEPTTCPDDTAHTIDSIQTYIEKTITENKFKIQEETVETGGHFCATSITINATKNATTCVSIEWPNHITALAMEMISEEVHRGDVIDLFVVKDLAIGGLMANAAPGTTWTSQNYVAGQTVTFNSKTYTCIVDTVSSEDPTDAAHWTRGIKLIVTPTVIENVDNGFFLSLFDGSSMNNVGRIISMDAANYTVYVETDVTSSFNFTTPTVVLLNVKSIHEYVLSAPWEHIFGANAIGGSHIPADLPVTICYTNNSTDTDKVLIGAVEYLY